VPAPSDPDPESLPAPRDLPAREGLPDPFQTLDGDRIETSDAWRERRRPELRRLFAHYVYGYAPEAAETAFAVRSERPILDGAGTLREVEIRFPGTGADPIPLALFHPGDGPVPVVLGLNRDGNHTVADDGAVTVTPSAREHGRGVADRGAEADFWCPEYLLERGYALATFHHADADPDRDEFTDGLHSRFEVPGPTGAGWGTLRAWAWGLQRALDYLAAADDLRESVLFGHSRRGKAALLAAATDERADVAAPHQSGTGGTALSRGNDQETVAAINESFPHWFNDVFPAFAGRERRLPVDQHLLIALVAPRPVLDTEGMRDFWANPPRALDALRGAVPVYDLLDAPGPAGNLLAAGDEITAESAGSLCQYRRDTGHTMERGYWATLCDFADLHV
jgi:hypothetical protein